MQTAVIGDIHGRIEVMVAALAKHDRVVFVGDYVDSFNRTKLDQIQCLTLALKEHNGGGVICLRGNHEESYIDPDARCSGWNSIMNTHVMSIKEQVRELPTHAWVDGILITHAGVSQHFIDEVLVDKYLYSSNLETAELVSRYLNETLQQEVGYARGGSKSCGGLLWCDFFEEFAPVDGLRQIFGHSGYRPVLRDKDSHDGLRHDTGVLANGENWNVDCLDYCTEYVLITDGVVSIEELEVCR